MPTTRKLAPARDDELAGDFPVGHPTHDHRQHLALPAGQDVQHSTPTFLAVYVKIAKHRISAAYAAIDARFDHPVDQPAGHTR